MEKFQPTDILLSVKKLVENADSDIEVNEQLENLAYEWKANDQQLKKIYQLMVSFYKEIEALGGNEKYKLTDISWLGIELELLFECYQLCVDYGVNIIDISQQLSNEGVNIFPKTPSQLQNTYYKVKKNHLPFENIIKSKPGRKKRTDAGFVPKSEKIRLAAQNEQTVAQKAQTIAQKEEPAVEPAPNSTVEYSEKNFVKLLSGMINNFQAIHQAQENGNDSMYRLMEGIYNLSSIAAQKSETSQKFENVELELQLLRNQLEESKREKEALIHDFRSLTDCIQEFINSSELMQIKALPQFIDDCKEKLSGLGLATTKENNVKLFIDNTGQLISISH